MLKKSLLLAASLVLAGPPAWADDRYATRPPVIVSPDLTAPWVMQLTGQGVSPAVSSRRIVTRQQAQQRRALRQRNPDGVQLAAVTGAARPVQTQMDPMFLPQIVDYETTHKAGTIVIDTKNKE